MTHRYCTVQDSGRVRIVTLNRLEVLNALHTDANDDLAAGWDEFAERDDLWVGIVTGAGSRAFSTNNHLKVQAAGKRRPNGPRGFAGLCHRFDLFKPMIAALNGWAMGGGFETALACDIIVAAENALFALPEPRVGLIAGGGGHRLPRSIPIKQAMGMILTERRVSAREGFELGFVTEVVPEGAALEAAKRWAARSWNARQGGAGVEAGRVLQPRRTAAGDCDAHGLSGAAGKPAKPGLHRKSAGLCREAQAGLAEQIGHRAIGIRLHDLYCDASGESHWRDIQIDWAEENDAGRLSARQPAYGIIFRQTRAEHDRPWHPAPRRQYIINLDAGVKITASDGEAREIGAGEVILVEDIRGKGHLSQSIGGKMRHSIFVPVD